jgi:hypothetical protein
MFTLADVQAHKEAPPLYHLFAYKPNSDDVIRGCLMASFDSDLQLYGPLTTAQLVHECSLLLLANERVASGEADYRLHILRNGVLVYSSDPYCTEVGYLNHFLTQTPYSEQTDEAYTAAEELNTFFYQQLLKEVIEPATSRAQAMLAEIKETERQRAEEKARAEEARELASRRALHEKLNLEFGAK